MPGAVRALSRATTLGISEARDGGGAGKTCSSQATNALSSVRVPRTEAQLAMSSEACLCWAATSVAVVATWLAVNRGGGGYAAILSFAEVFPGVVPATLAQVEGPKRPARMATTASTATATKRRFGVRADCRGRSRRS